METSTAWVLTQLKYGDSQIIAHFYTKKWGRISGIYRRSAGSKKSKGKKMYFPLSHVELTYKNNKGNALKNVHNLQPYQLYASLHSHPVKVAIVQFLAEIMDLSLKETEPNPQLYHFINNQLNLLDEKKEQLADFHLHFMLSLTQYLGFYPNDKNASLYPFDLQEGQFLTQIQSSSLSDSYSQLFGKLLQFSFDLNSTNHFNQKERQILLDVLVKYYQIHLPEFRTPKSLEILRVLF